MVRFRAFRESSNGASLDMACTGSTCSKSPASSRCDPRSLSPRLGSTSSTKALASLERSVCGYKPSCTPAAPASTAATGDASPVHWSASSNGERAGTASWRSCITTGSIARSKAKGKAAPVHAAQAAAIGGKSPAPWRTKKAERSAGESAAASKHRHTSPRWPTSPPCVDELSSSVLSSPCLDSFIRCFRRGLDAHPIE
eukprot:scaffold108024_cov31-Tisochrysis_lutea.AAC.2